MKILLDECTPHVLKRLLTEVEITTVQDLGWTGITNGSLLQLAEGQFDVLVTSDQNLRYSKILRTDSWPLFNCQRTKFLS